MKRWLYQHETVDGAPEELDRALRHRVRDLLATVTDGGQAQRSAEGDLIVRIPGHVLGLDLHKMVRLHTGVAERRGVRTYIPLRWHAEPGRHAFPTFEGMIELEPQSASIAHLTIVGAATLPLGAVGFVADAAGLALTADRTLAHLTKSLAAALEDVARTSEPDRQQSASVYRLQVRDVMTPNPLVLDEDMPLKTAALLLFHYNIAGAPVRTAAGGLAGVLSEADLLDKEAPLRYGLSRAVDASRRSKEARTVGEACSRPAVEVVATASVAAAAELMRDHSVARLIAVDDSEIVGVVTRHDVLRALLRTDLEVQTLLERLLAELNEDDVTVSVEWGVVHLKGRASTRSATRELLNRIEEVDGVVAVGGDLAWEVDDVLPQWIPMA